jgi:hypothetical protein
MDTEAFDGTFAADASDVREPEPEPQPEPPVELVVTLDKNFDDIPEGSTARLEFEASAKDDLARLLGISTDDIDIAGIRAGSVILDFTVRNLDTSAANAAEDLHQKLMSGVAIGNASVKQVDVRMGKQRWRWAARMVSTASLLSRVAAAGAGAGTEPVVEEVEATPVDSQQVSDKLQRQVRVVLTQAKAASEATRLAVSMSNDEVAEMRDSLLQRQASAASMQRDFETLLQAQQMSAAEEKASAVAALEAEIAALRQQSKLEPELQLQHDIQTLLRAQQDLEQEPQLELELQLQPQPQPQPQPEPEPEPETEPEMELEPPSAIGSSGSRSSSASAAILAEIAALTELDLELEAELIVRDATARAEAAPFRRS